MAEPPIRIRKFNPDILEKNRIDPNKGPCTILLVGCKRTGKSTLMEDLVYHCRNIPAGIIVTGSASTSEEFSKFFPKSCIFNNLDKSMNTLIDRIITKQEKKRKRNYDPKKFTCLVLMDDCGYDDKFFRNNKTLNKLFMNGRHYNMLTIISLQYCKSVPPTLRGNSDYVFILREPSRERRRDLWKEFAGNIQTFELFCTIMDQLTENHGCMVVDRTVITNNIEDCIFHYRAAYPVPKFKAGSKSLWKKHKMYYKSDSEDETNTKKCIV
jgi:hypothetical protein